MKKRASRLRVARVRAIKMTPHVKIPYLYEVNSAIDPRDELYGTLSARSHGTQRIKETMRAQPKWGSLADDQKEALEMIAHKIGRILCGDPDYVYSWHDIMGYARLVKDRLVADEKASQP